MAHNYISSAQGRASVMDYPGPRIDIKADKTLDLSNTHASGIGDWDKISLAWGYSQFGENNIRVGASMASLDEVLEPWYFLHRYQTDAASKVPWRKRIQLRSEGRWAADYKDCSAG